MTEREQQLVTVDLSRLGEQLWQPYQEMAGNMILQYIGSATLLYSTLLYCIVEYCTVLYFV